MNTTYQKIINIAENFFAPGERCIYSSILDQSVVDVMVNQYGEDWKKNDYQLISDNLRKNFNKDAYRKDVPYFYMLYYMPINVPKVQIVLNELFRKKEMKGDLRILDVGCAVGTTLFAVIDYIAILDNICSLMGEEPIFKSITIDMVDWSRDNADALKKLQSHYISRMSGFMDMSKIKIGDPVIGDMRESQNLEGEYDLAIFSNSISEVKYKERFSTVENFDQYIKPGGHLLFIEQASETKVKALGRLKYEIGGKLGYKPIGPCGISKKCENCWNFRCEDGVNRGTLRLMDKVLEKESKDFHNSIHKWTYSILEKSVESVEEIIDSNNRTKRFFVVSKNNVVPEICSINTSHKAYLDFNGHQKKKLRYGDIVHFDEFDYDKSKNRIKLNGELDIDGREPSRNDKIEYKNVQKKPLEFFLYRIWGFDSFREGQYEIIEKAMKDNNGLGILPTGAGKSLCFQLPAMMKTGGSIIVSPLKSLMKDQVDNLNALGFDFVDFIDSSRSSSEKKEILERFKSGNIKMLYVAPERLQLQSFQKEIIDMIKEVSIDYFIIDEAHCASEWGHDFRPSYLKLVDVVEKLNNPTIIAVTATASQRVKEDILDIFHLPGDSVLMSKSLDRPEISFSVENINISETKDDHLLKVLKEKIPSYLGEDSIEEIHKSGSGIVFTVYANSDGSNTLPFTTKYISELINDENIKAFTYHSKLNDSIRAERQNRFKRDEFPLLISTKGFGMGIDKPNIDYIVHMCYSASLEAYYQEAGRAGRDGEHAHSVIIAKQRHPNCITKSKNLGDNAPICTDRWDCSYTGGLKCDYGLQAKFIENEYPDIQEMIEDISSFVEELSLKEEQNFEASYLNDSKNGLDVKRAQKYLFYLQKEGMVKDYLISGHKTRTTSLQISMSEEQRKLDKGRVVKNIVDRLQEFKDQKYTMLYNIWEYSDNSTSCRRQFLMDYFGENADYKEGCGFCDIEGISRERAVKYTPTLRSQRVFEQLQENFVSSSFEFLKLQQIINEGYGEDIQESLKVRAMRYLEDYPNNIAALYISGTITLRRELNEVYGRNQMFNCIKKLLESNQKASAYVVIFELLEYAEELAYNITVETELASKDADFLELFLNNIKDNKMHDYFGLLFMTAKVNKLNEILKGSAD